MAENDQLSSVLSLEEINAGIKQKLQEYHYLITDETARYLLSLEKFGTQAQVCTIAQAKARASPSILHVRIKRVFVPQIFERGASVSRTQRVEVEDQTGTFIIACYDELGKKIEQQVLIGDLVQIGPMRMRGREFALMQGGEIKILQKGARAKLNSSTTYANFEGEITQVHGDFEYSRGQTKLDGGAQKALMSAFEIEDGTGRIRVVKWDSPGLATSLKKGMKVGIENGVRRNGELHIGSGARLVFEPFEEKRPQIENIKIDESKIVVSAQGTTVVFDDMESAAVRFGLGQIPNGISPITAIELKMKDWIGKPLPKKWEEKIQN
ncbi:MAG: hypothetical protein WC492_00835 [Candidatus Micrarchaeia archaeon]